MEINNKVLLTLFYKMTLEYQKANNLKNQLKIWLIKIKANYINKNICQNKTQKVCCSCQIATKLNNKYKINSLTVTFSSTKHLKIRLINTLIEQTKRISIYMW